MKTTVAEKRSPLTELLLYFLRLGLLGFGGPVALVGQMERELVTDRGWLTKEQMREAIAICQSLPGPLAIQVGIYISYLRGGFWGAWAGGWAFIFPNFVIVAAAPWSSPPLLSAISLLVSGAPSFRPSGFSFL